MKGEFFHVPLDVATTPRDGLVLCDRYWAVHPEKGLAFYMNRGMDDPSPQCNSARTITERMSSMHLADHEVQLVPCVYLSHAKSIAKQHVERLRRQKRYGSTGEKGNG